MTKALWKLTVRGDFAAAHALRHYEGKCEDLHGHNYLVEMVVEGETLTPDTELVADFTLLKRELRAELALIDHRYLNELPPFDVINPSSENLARYLYRKMKERLSNLPVRMYSMTVGETPLQSATYQEMEG
ncbi:6-pyruvoyl trahydropterin synthase family protein [Mailhella massiliensis]|uniref:6-pyruvoyl trahydropterin synthase family protein n=1 Tax=Mailhella massiliensis TaxID=1903261 RepID=UPI00097D7B2F|nr:6-carboxytetrahydropterin synthase [Mailhella massiliensis]